MSQLHEMRVQAILENIPEVLNFLKNSLMQSNCEAETISQLELAVEEIFVNIASYAYTKGQGQAIIRIDLSDTTRLLTLQFEDTGVPFNPLNKEAPDINAPLENRDIGGLGIFIVNTIMDEVSYEYKDNKNILTLKKRI